MTSEQYVRNIWHQNKPLIALQKMINLWTSACKWSNRIRRDGSPLMGGVRERRFREMIRRTAHHRAHAEWLVQELYEMGKGVSIALLGAGIEVGPAYWMLLVDGSSARASIEPWRLASPSGVHLYVTDCMITTTLSVCNPPTMILMSSGQPRRMIIWSCTPARFSNIPTIDGTYPTAMEHQARRYVLPGKAQAHLSWIRFRFAVRLWNGKC